MNRRRVPRPVGFAALACATLLSACIVVPQTRDVYDPECQIVTRQITLETAVIGGFQGCYGDGCAAMLVTMGAVTAVSAVVSGSVALVGNVVYWIERQGRCIKRDATPQPRPESRPESRPDSRPAPAPT